MGTRTQAVQIAKHTTQQDPSRATGALTGQTYGVGETFISLVSRNIDHHPPTLAKAA